MTKAKKSSTQLAEVKTGGAVALVEAVPQGMEQFAGQGLEQLKQDDVDIPRVTLLQALSKQVTEGDAAPGTFYHISAEESLGNAMRIVPIYCTVAYMLWRPRHEGGGILAKSVDGVNWSPPDGEFKVKPLQGSDYTTVWKTKKTVAESGLHMWGSSVPTDPQSQPAATKMFNILCVNMDNLDMGPFVVTLQRGALPVAKTLTQKLGMVKAPVYGQVFNMSVSKKTAPKGTFFVPSFERVGYVPYPSALFTQLQDTHALIAKRGLSLKDDEIEDGESHTHAGTPDDGAIGV